MQQTETGNSGWWQVDLLVEVQGNGKGATKCCCNIHCNIDEQSPHQEKQGYTSARNTTIISWTVKLQSLYTLPSDTKPYT